MLTAAKEKQAGRSDGYAMAQRGSLQGRGRVYPVRQDRQGAPGPGLVLSRLARRYWQSARCAGAPPASTMLCGLARRPITPFNPNRFHFNFRWFWDYAGGLMTDWGVHLLNICLWAMGPETPLRVMSSGGKYVLDDAMEQPDTQVSVYEFPSYTLVFEQQVQGGIGPGNRPHGMLFLRHRSHGHYRPPMAGKLSPSRRRKSVEAITHPAGGDARPAHVRNFPRLHEDAARSGREPGDRPITFRPWRTWAISRCAPAPRCIGTASAKWLPTAPKRTPWSPAPIAARGNCRITPAKADQDIRTPIPGL